MSEARKKLREMTADELRAYHRDATARWRARHPEAAERQKAVRRERLGSETALERDIRMERERAYREGRREESAKVAKQRRLKNYDAVREKERQASKRYREKDIDLSREREREYARKNYERYKPRIVANNKKRKALLRGAANAEVIRLEALAERDGWRCHICGERVVRATWSMDHLIPLSKGGDHTYVNVALAHQTCNKRRSAGALPAQLRLIG